MEEGVKQPAITRTRGRPLSFFRWALILGSVAAGGMVGISGILGPDDVPDVFADPQTSAEGASQNSVAERLSSASGNAFPPKFIGGIHTDRAGRIIPDSALRELFDAIHHLDSSDSPDRNRMRRYLSDEGRRYALAAEQLLELDRIFTRYLDYLEHSSTADARNFPAYHDVSSMRTALDARREMRRNMLGQEVANGFFGDNEAGDRQTLRHLENYALPAGQRVQNEPAISSIDVNKNRAERHSGNDVVNLVALHEKVELMRQSGASQAQIDAVRTAALDTEIAERFSLADREVSAIKRENFSAAPFHLSK